MSSQSGNFYPGIIPTRVGTSPVRAGQCQHYTDHPHACGDKQKSYPLTRLKAGSSPRVWGQDILTNSGATVQGIIPTRVGTRTITARSAQMAGDHPHACGDKKTPLKTRHQNRGSSPRVWGQDYFIHGWSIYWRIIPTRVGTRACALPFLQRRTDHPHACGDKRGIYND